MGNIATELEGCVGQDGPKGILGVPLTKERGTVLDKAKAIINGDRQDQYGNPEDSFYTISQLWNIYIRTRPLPNTLTEKDVAMMMALMKFAREMKGAGKEDNLIDAAGYIGLAADMSNYNKKENNND